MHSDRRFRQAGEGCSTHKSKKKPKTNGKYKKGKIKGKRQKAKGKRQKAKGNDEGAIGEKSPDTP
jgi:hypothetical protein